MAGAFDIVRNEFDLIGFGGTSGGAVLAACGSFLIPADEIKKTIVKMLDGRMISISLNSFGRSGLLNWNLIGDEIDRVFGKCCKLGDSDLPLVVCVTDLDTGKPKYLSKLSTPFVLLREALQASTAFMCFATPAIRIPSLSVSPLSPDIRLFCDGGWTDNTCDHVFDHRKEPRISLRLNPNYDVERVREFETLKIQRAVFRASLYAQSQRKSRRLDGINLDIDIRNNWDFSKNISQIESSYKQGSASAVQQLKKQEL
jgi:predicted acylesterase/phospholipase RssA